jgi:hypothetical protein
MPQLSKKDLAREYARFRFGSSGLGNFVHEQIDDEVFRQLTLLDETPLTKVQLNQLLVLSNAGSMSDGFFKYYWLLKPEHPYDVTRLPYYAASMTGSGDQNVQSHDHLRWGLYRLYVDGLLYFGNVAAAFRALRSKTLEELVAFFKQKRFDTEAISQRGPALPLEEISKDDRYLISEMACKTFGEIPKDKIEARKLLQDALKKHRGGPITFRDLIDGFAEDSNREQLLLSYDDVLDTTLTDEAELNRRFDEQFNRFQEARTKATRNTALYLSMVNDLDVYVATSMRKRQNFRDMATACEKIFSDARLRDFHLRYFDPTMSAARGHEDKGLIECLMVKCAKVLVYTEGEKESNGKDAEAAMALSLGKPVIFYCDKGVKTRFYRDVHPLSRLIDFRSGVAVGAIVSDSIGEVTELVRRIFANEMEYEFRHHETRPGYLKLHEKLTDSVVRLQTNDELLTTTFWNNYHNRQQRVYPTLVAGKEAERLFE